MSRYDDIISLPHHVSMTHPHMPVADRAAQFAPFAALTGYGDVIDETARLTDARAELSEDRLAELDLKLRALAAEKDAEATVVYFVEDGRKEGGSYQTYCGRIARVDSANRRIITADGCAIPFGSVMEIVL